MLTRINLALMTAFAALNTVYLPRRRTRILADRFNAESGPGSAHTPSP